MGYFQFRYNSRVVNYDRRGFIRLATDLQNLVNKGHYFSALIFSPTLSTSRRSWPTSCVATLTPPSSSRSSTFRWRSDSLSSGSRVHSSTHVVFLFLPKTFWMDHPRPLFHLSFSFFQCNLQNKSFKLQSESSLYKIKVDNFKLFK